MTTRIPEHISAQQRKIETLKDRPASLRAAAQRILAAEEKAGRDPVAGDTAADKASFEKIDAAWKKAEAATLELWDAKDALNEMLENYAGTNGRNSVDTAGTWAERVGAKLFGQSSNDTSNPSADHYLDMADRPQGSTSLAALISGPVTVETLIRDGVVTMPEVPTSVIDLIANRERLETSPHYSFLRQTVRTGNAAAVPDGVAKPTSTYTLAPIEGKAPVIAHLSPAMPIRYIDDLPQATDFLRTEMAAGILDRIEVDIISGDGTDDTYEGILSAPGTTEIAYQSSPLTTARRAVTSMQVLHERPTAWVLHPLDAEQFDLSTDNSGAFHDSIAARVFGSIPTVVSTSVPAGTAVLGDFGGCRLFVRQEMTLESDTSGELFGKNEFRMRAEARIGFAVTRPTAFTIVEIADPNA